MLGPRARRWARLLDGFPERIRGVRSWRGWRHPPRDGVGHLHHVPTLVACLDGTVRIERPGERLDLASGEVLVIAPGVWHHHSAPRGKSVAWMQGFMPGISDVMCWDAEGWWAGRMPNQPSRLLMERVLRTTSVAGARDLFKQALREDIQPLAAVDDPAVRKMLRQFWWGLTRGITAAEVVKASGLGRSRAWALFSHAYGMPLHQALLDARCSLAVGLLDAGHGPGEAARLAGFAHAAAFARARRMRPG